MKQNNRHVDLVIVIALTMVVGFILVVLPLAMTSQTDAGRAYKSGQMGVTSMVTERTPTTECADLFRSSECVSCHEF